MRIWGPTLVAAVFFAASLSAQPRNGSATGPNGELLQFQCTPTPDGLSCDFIQISFLQNATVEDLQARLEDIDELLAETQAGLAGDDTTEVCSFLEDFFAAFEFVQQGRIEDATSLLSQMSEMDGFDATEFEERMATEDPRFLEEMLERMALSLALCEDVTLERVEALVRFEHALDTRTCRPLISTWEDDFVQVSEQVWGLANSEPYGPCGAVQLDRFVCAYPNSFVCNFLSETRVLNPEGQMFGGGTCARLDDGIREFDIAAEPHYLDCDRIDF
jgi:hypothetical protein